MKKKGLLLLVTVVALCALLIAPVTAQDRVVVTWFVGLGTGSNEQQIAAQNAVVEAFNASQDAIRLEIILAASNQVAADTLSTLIAGGTPPDIVGPVGFSGANAFSGQWLDLQPLVDSTGYDLSRYPENLVALYQSPEGLLGIPFAVFPSLMFYNKALFDEAGLEYPPAEFDAPYMLDGEAREWNWDTVAEIGAILTVDASGNDATMAGFDASAIEQFGFVHQWGTMRADLSTFGGGEFYDAETNTVTIPEWWRANAAWTHEGLWGESRFIPNSTYENSQLFTPTVFASGRTAMARVPLWYTCCIGDLSSPWDIAVVPGYEGMNHSPTDADTFRILASTDAPEESFAVLSYLLNEAALDLLTVYGGFPADPALQPDFVAALQARYPSVENWAIIPPSLERAAVPNHEYDFPNFNRGQNRFADFRTLLYGDTGAGIDVNAELDRLQADLQALVDSAS